MSWILVAGGYELTMTGWTDPNPSNPLLRAYYDMPTVPSGLAAYDYCTLDGGSSLPVPTGEYGNSYQWAPGVSLPTIGTSDVNVDIVIFMHSLVTPPPDAPTELSAQYVVSQPPKLTLSVSPPSGDLTGGSMNVTLTAHNTGDAPTSVVWDFGDGTTG